MNKVDLKATSRQRAYIRREMDALETILVTLTPLDFDERCRVMRWACERWGISVTRLTPRTLSS